MSDPRHPSRSSGSDTRERLTFASEGVAGVHYARCEPCMYGQCPGGQHRWAGPDDIAFAESIHDPASAEGRCACHCYDEPERVEELPAPDVEEVSIDGPPCHLCGADGACGYDAEGRPYIHASWDEDDTEEVR